jgi:4-hydroxy-tetrahydrodipicolinate reductase
VILKSKQQGWVCPVSHLNGHAFDTYQVVSADGMVVFEFQHNVCGRPIYGQGTVDAVLFLAKKVRL